MKVLHYRYATLPYRNTFTFLMSLLAMSQPNVFLYGRGTENRTLINRLKAYYFAVKLCPQHLITLVTSHDSSPLDIFFC